MTRYYTKLDFCAELVDILNRGESVANWAYSVPFLKPEMGGVKIVIDKEVQDKLYELEFIEEEGFEMSQQEIFGILINFLEQCERECSEDSVEG